MNTPVLASFSLSLRWVLLAVCVGLTGCSCGTNSTQPPPSQVTIPKVECRFHGDCPYPKQCLYDTCTLVPERPIIRLVVPSQPTEGSLIQLHVFGNFFGTGAVVAWDKTPLTTTPISPTELLAELPNTADNSSHEVTVIHPNGATSKAYLLSLQKTVTLERLSFSQIPVGCGKETLVLWGYPFWKQIQVSIASADGKQEWSAESVEIRPNGELHAAFDFSKLTKGTYQLLVHHGDKTKATKHPLLVVDTQPDPVLVSWGPRQFWWGSQATVFLTGLHLTHIDLRFQQQPIRVLPINRSTYSISLDLNELPRQQQTSLFWLTVRKICQTQQTFYPIEVHDIPKPTITQTTPTTITHATTEDILIQGDGFHPDASLWINHQEITQAKRLSLQQFRIPREVLRTAGSWPVQIRNPQYLHSNLWNITVDHTPTIANIFPSLLRKKRDQKVTLEGSNFGPQVQVKVGDTLVEDVERIDATRLFIPSQTFGLVQTYSVVVINPGEPAFSSSTYSFQVQEGPQIDTLSSPLILLDHSEGDIQVRGSDFDEKGQLLVDGQPVNENYAVWVNDVSWNLAVRFFTQEGEYKLQVRNTNQVLSNPVVLWVRKADKKLLKDIKEVGELTYLCGTQLRQDGLPMRPRIGFYRQTQSQPLIEVEASNSTFDTACLYFNTRDIAPLEPQTYLVRVCQDDGQETLCSNEYPWEWRGLSQTTAPKTYPPQIHWLRPLQPNTWVWTTETKTYTIMLGGTHLRGQTKVWINGIEMKPDESAGGKTRLSVLDDRIILYEIPVPSPVHGTHLIQVQTQHGSSNTYFFRIAQEPFLSITWTPQLFIPRDDSYNFKWYGYNLTTALWLFMDDVQVKVGTAALPWSQFASTPPHFLSSFDWTESSKLKLGLRKLQLKDSKTNVTSNALWLPAGNDEYWGEEPLALQAAEDTQRYANSAGLAPYVGQSSTLRLGYTGFASSATDAKLRGTVWIEQQSKTYASGVTSLDGYSYVDVATIAFSGSPRVVPIFLRHPNGKQSNTHLLTVMPTASYRLTKVYNAIDFSSIIRPEQPTQLQIHGNFLSKEDVFYFLGQPVPVDHAYRDADSGDEFVRITLQAGDLPEGQYPLWAINPKKQISNSLLISVRRQGIGGAPRLRSVNPMVLSKTALAPVQYKARIVIQAIGLTPQTQAILDKKAYSLQWIHGELAYLELDVSSINPGDLSIVLRDSASLSQSTPFLITLEK